MAQLNRLLPMVLALSTGAVASAVIANATHAYDRRAILTTAPTRQLVAGDDRRPGSLAAYSAEIARAPVSPALLNRWVAAAPSADDRSRGLALLRGMGFRDAGAQVNIMIDALLSGDIADVVERIDGLLAQQVGRVQAIETLSHMERMPQFATALVRRLDRKPRWGGRYLFDPALLADPEGRRARLRTLAALRPGADTVSAYAFASRESWKRHDFAMADAFWQRGAAQRTELGLPIGRSSFPFDWRAMTSADFETAVVPEGDLMVVSIQWNSSGAAPFLVRNRLGPVRADARLARMVAPPEDNGRIMVIYRCQGAGWIAARPVTSGRETVFRASRELECAAAEVAIVPATRSDGSTAIQFDLFAESGTEGRS